jgi:phosphomevalonate kinase
MGSSAALTTALVAALLQFFDIIKLPSANNQRIATTTTSDDDDENDRRILHNLAQLAHAVAQGKLGSGFDVAAAVYGMKILNMISDSKMFTYAV